MVISRNLWFPHPSNQTKVIFVGIQYEFITTHLATTSSINFDIKLRLDTGL